MELVDQINAVKRKRFDFLKVVYEKSGGSEYQYLNALEIGQSIGLDQAAVNNVLQYLSGERLANAGMGMTVNITHYGIVEMERALTEPDKPTEHFLPVNIVAVGSMVNSQIQQASNGSIQTLQITENNLKELASLMVEIDELSKSGGLDSVNKADLDAGVSTVKAQLSASKPSPTIISEAVRSIRTVLEGAAGNVLAQAILARLVQLSISGQ